jgi:hypothetical protein
MPETEKKESRDLQADSKLVMQDLLSWNPLRHSLDPPVSDFTNAAGVPPEEVLSILTNWHNQGLVFSKIPNDNFAGDGVETCWRLNWNGYMAVRDRTDQGGEPVVPPAILNSISPNTGVRATTVTVTATGSNFDQKSYISVPGAANVGTSTLVSETELTADVQLPNAPGTLNVTVIDQTWGTETDPQPFTVTPNI